VRISIDRPACMGHGRCYALAPDLCEPDDDGYGVVVQAEVTPELEAEARAAAGGCPERAVALLSDEGER
jgi:ferredoxin